MTPRDFKDGIEFFHAKSKFRRWALISWLVLSVASLIVMPDGWRILSLIFYNFSCGVIIVDAWDR